MLISRIFPIKLAHSSTLRCLPNSCEKEQIYIQTLLNLKFHDTHIVLDRIFWN